MNKALPFSMRFDPDLKADLQRLADAENRSLSNFIETRLRQIVADSKAKAAGGERK